MSSAPFGVLSWNWCVWTANRDAAKLALLDRLDWSVAALQETAPESLQRITEYFPAADIASAYWSTSSCSKSSAACAFDNTKSPAPPCSATKPISHRLQRGRPCVDVTPKQSLSVKVHHSTPEPVRNDVTWANAMRGLKSRGSNLSA